MKKVLSVLLTMALVSTMTACGGGAGAASGQEAAASRAAQLSAFVERINSEQQAPQTGGVTFAQMLEETQKSNPTFDCQCDPENSQTDEEKSIRREIQYKVFPFMLGVSILPP